MGGNWQEIARKWGGKSGLDVGVRGEIWGRRHTNAIPIGSGRSVGTITEKMGAIGNGGSKHSFSHQRYVVNASLGPQQLTVATD